MPPGQTSCAGTTTRCGRASGSTGARSSTPPATGSSWPSGPRLRPSPAPSPSSRRWSSTGDRAASPCPSASACTARSPTDRATTTAASASTSRLGWRRWPMAARSWPRRRRCPKRGPPRPSAPRTVSVKGVSEPLSVASVAWQGTGARSRVGERGGRLDPMSAVLPIYFESGSTRVFAGALDWPGWCRSAQVRGRGGRRAAGLSAALHDGARRGRAARPRPAARDR